MHKGSPSSTLAVTLAFACSVLVLGLAAQQKAQEKPRYKGIFEPVNYPDDVTLASVHFVDENTGWAAGGGKGGVILHTKDGGDNWEVQFGDLGSSEPAFKFLRFLDASHGWVQQGNDQLLRTTDGGRTWEELGRSAVLGHQGLWTFVSPMVGFGAAGENILRTEDGGRNWKPVFACQAKVEVDGLTRNVACQPESFHFPSARIGYAVGYTPAPAPMLFVMKTEDGGTTWSVLPPVPGASGKESAVFFTSEQDGVMRVLDGRFFATSDGGQTWRGIAGAKVEGRPPLHFAGNVGWSIGYRKLVYTTDGGRRWSSRELPFPANVNDFTLPRSNRGYVVGEGGMIYRYKVVPVGYKVPRGIDAPAMPGPTAEEAKSGALKGAGARGIYQAPGAGALPVALTSMAMRQWPSAPRE